VFVGDACIWCSQTAAKRSQFEDVQRDWRTEQLRLRFVKDR
jgi:hypothetical protein